jgi:hypothetical protein
MQFRRREVGSYPPWKPTRGAAPQTDYYFKGRHSKSCACWVRGLLTLTCGLVVAAFVLCSGSSRPVHRGFNRDRRKREFWPRGSGAKKLHAARGCSLVRFEEGHARLVLPNVRVKPAPTAWRAGQQAQNGPKAQRLMAGVPRCWGSA